MAKAEEQAKTTMNPAIAFIRLGRFPYAIEAMLRGAVGALCYAYECVQLIVHLQARLMLHSQQQQVDSKRIFLSTTLIFLVNSAVNYLNDWADYT